MRELSKREVEIVAGGEITANDVAGTIVCGAAGLTASAIGSLVFTPFIGAAIGAGVGGACGIAWAAKD